MPNLLNIIILRGLAGPNVAFRYMPPHHSRRTFDDACTRSCISFSLGCEGGSRDPHQLARPAVALPMPDVSVLKLPKADMNHAESCKALQQGCSSATGGH